MSLDLSKLKTIWNLVQARLTSWEWWKSDGGLWTGATVFVILLLPVLFFFPGRESITPTALTAETKDAPAARLSVQLDTNEFRKGQQETLRVTLLNRGTDALTGLQVRVLAPGFELSQPEDGTCGDRDEHGIARLAANQPCSYSIRIKAIARSGTYTLTVKAHWFQRQPESRSLNVGTVYLHGALGADAWQRFGSRVAQTSKDLTFPLLLLVFTTVLGRWQKDRETARADIERKRGEQAQVRQLLLSKVTSMAERHYLKISAAGKGMLDARSDLANKRESTGDRLFYNAMLLVWHMTLLKEECGGLFFRDRKSEEIVSRAWSILKPALVGVVGEDQVAIAIALLRKDTGQASFQQNRRRLRPGMERLSHWYAKDDPSIVDRYASLDEFLPVIDLMQAVFLFETNVPLDEYWYKESRPLRYSSDPFKVPPQAIMNEAQRRAADGLVELFAPYRERNRIERVYPD